MTAPPGPIGEAGRPARGPALHKLASGVGRWLDRYLPRGATITVACSGGADSLALALGVLSEAPRQGYAIAAATVDHGLQADSDIHAETVAAQLRSLGYDDVRVLAVQVRGPGGVEAAARAARYAALLPLARGGAVLLGHTLDDQAETVLLGLSRGSGPRSMAGMPEFAAPFGRPLLNLRRSDSESVCAEAGIEPWRDPHNENPAFVRARLRHEVMPLLEKVLGGGVAAALARTATQLQEDGEVLDSLSATLARQAVTGSELSVNALRDEPAALRRRAERWWLLASGVSGLTANHLLRVDRLVVEKAAGQAVRLPGNRDVVRDADVLRLRAAR